MLQIKKVIYIQNKNLWPAFLYEGSIPASDEILSKKMNIKSISFTLRNLIENKISWDFLRGLLSVDECQQIIEQLELKSEVDENGAKGLTTSNKYAQGMPEFVFIRDKRIGKTYLICYCIYESSPGIYKQYVQGIAIVKLQPELPKNVTIISNQLKQPIRYFIVFGSLALLVTSWLIAILGDKCQSLGWSILNPIAFFQHNSLIINISLLIIAFLYYALYKLWNLVTWSVLFFFILFVSIR